MFTRFGTLYREFFDETLSNNTLLVAIIAGMILGIGIFSPTYAQNIPQLQTNIIAASPSDASTPVLIEVEGHTYEVILKKYK